MARICATGRQHLAAAELGVLGRRADLQLRSRARPPTLGLCGLSCDRRCALPFDDEDFHRRKHSSDGRGLAATVTAGGDSTRRTTYEFGTFFADVSRGAFQFYSLRWIGANEDPDIFEYAFHSSKFTPNGANRSFYSNPKVDALIDQARSELDQEKRKQLYAQLQRILAEDLPSINLWYLDNVLVHSQRVTNLSLNPPGNYDFLRTAQIASNE